MKNKSFKPSFCAHVQGILSGRFIYQDGGGRLEAGGGDWKDTLSIKSVLEKAKSDAGKKREKIIPKFCFG